MREIPTANGAIPRLMEELGKLPGIGPKSAERITHYLIASDKSKVLHLADLLRAIKEKIQRCNNCCNLTENDLCEICSNPRRDGSVLCVVEQPRDLAAVERSGRFSGQYHVLHGRLAPLENMGPDNLTINHLMKRIDSGTVKEVIMATNPNLEGDGTALYLSSLLSATGVKVTRLARGLSSGAGLEFANVQSLADALEGRRAL